ncbi:sigma-54-dependent Fis family transcriptional regulator [Salipaludibacillus keqinensis]|uniref:Sigma-54-dependent Fis family transcriptional regulator n=1 Tax=Salipaludibacillus keqinensis TaxID=2045207 RepID=A0A323TBV8_9BACI|nr:sigma-54 dependent transcriptional regulator [Salipaludibacillus keqinensis]PYZ92651.1 sigma-54-dependent Fis family transcriptional regulator [Salipaludibacillus keqinensis]
MVHMLILDDEQSICSSLTFALEDNYKVTATTDPQEAVDLVEHNTYQLCLLDLKIGNVDGVSVLKQFKQLQPSMEVIMITAYGTIESSVAALQNGAFSYITKPVNMDELHANIKKALKYKELNQQVEYLSRQLEKKYRYEEMVGQSEKMQKVFQLIDKVKEVDTNILITGESGTGKELVARAIHYSGKRNKGPLEIVNCAAIPEQLLESELFGYEKGAFTGAVSSKPGKFELANKGTIFLDEIGDMPQPLQAKLLRILQTREVTRLGSNEKKQLDVRVIAATNLELEKEMNEGTFREDLYFRLNVIEIHTPPLRERKSDLPFLINYFIDKNHRELGVPKKTFTKEAQSRMLSYDFPGNIRELANIIEASMVFAEGDEIGVTDLPASMKRPGKQRVSTNPSASLQPFIGFTVKELEKQFILTTLEHQDGHKQNTARTLGISERSLRDKLKLYEDK